MVTRALEFHTDFLTLHLDGVIFKSKGLGSVCCHFKDSLLGNMKSLSFGHFHVGALGC